MATLTVRRLEEADRDWLKREALRREMSTEEYVRQMIRTARQSETRRFGDVLDDMNASLDDETRVLLDDAPAMERSSLRARDVFSGDEDDASAEAAS